MKNKKCNHRSFWQIYKIINFNRSFFSDKETKYVCENCSKKFTIKWKGYEKMMNSKYRYLSYLLWMTPGIILIILVALQIMNFLVAIALIIIFHFGAMYLIINSDNLIIKEFEEKESYKNKSISKDILKILFKIIILLIFLYISIIIYLFFVQKSMVYFPDKTDFYNCDNFEEEEKKEFLGTRFYEKIGEENNLIIFFHGNAGRACERVYIKSLLEKTGNSIIFMEYSGFADSDISKLDMKYILKDVENLGEYVYQKNFSNVYVFGRSLGTGVGAYYSSIFKTDKILLVSPYNQLYKIASDRYPIFPVKYLFTQNYNSEDYLKDYKNELLIIHGNKDQTIPLKYGKLLYDSLNTTKKDFLKIENGNHDNIFNSDMVENKIFEFLR